MLFQLVAAFPIVGRRSLECHPLLYQHARIARRVDGQIVEIAGAARVAREGGQFGFQEQNPMPMADKVVNY